ncbi:YhcH/YjgK/YiaL family protein, partial [Prevotella histicola]|uniref:YhcH/YjgK/YiaL family protein n=1 Tax=Prevotella histicola TaxID=470565 RepID=UPI00241C6578
MIIADLESCRRYYALHEEMEELFRYIRNHDFSCQAPGRITLLGNKLFINLDEVELKSKEEQYLEFHQRYIDVQIPLLKEEVMGWSPINLREFGIRKGLKKLVISSKIRIFIGEN